MNSQSWSQECAALCRTQPSIGWSRTVGHLLRAWPWTGLWIGVNSLSESIGRTRQKKLKSMQPGALWPRPSELDTHILAVKSLSALIRLANTLSSWAVEKQAVGWCWPTAHESQFAQHWRRLFLEEFPRTHSSGLLWGRRMGRGRSRFGEGLLFYFVSFVIFKNCVYYL